MEDYVTINQAYKVPQFLRGLIAKYFIKSGERRKGHIFKCIGNKNVKDYHNTSFDKVRLLERLDNYVKEQGFDAILSPAFPIPAFKHGDFNKVTTCFYYCSMWNFYDYPTCVIPRVKVIQKEDINPDEYTDKGFRTLGASIDGKFCPNL